MREAGETVNLFPADPALGSPLVVSITDGEVWRLETFFVIATTDIAATPRDLRLEFMTLAGLVYWQTLWSTTIANTSSRQVCAVRNGAVLNASTVIVQAKLPDTSWLFNFGNSERLRFNLVPFGAGDQLNSAALTYRRWRE